MGNELQTNKARILVVDDSEVMIRIIKKALIDHGYDVVGEAKNGKEACDLYSELNPDIVTMDITMPILDGISALKIVKGMDKNAKVIICSAAGQQSFVREALNAGAKDFLVKPFSTDKLIAAISKLVT